ncbi:MAG: asparagine--tRNA ligase [Nitrospira sp.]|nr:asparagine--tRNA ligase [bacterium]MBL7050432.1 asparagine--tRNA ligase [Nitrospira sp.]
MKKINIKRLIEQGKSGQQVTVYGWVKSKRDSKGIVFIAVGDGSTFEPLQLIFTEDSIAFQATAECHTGAAIQASGTLQDSPGKGQKFEVSVKELLILGKADPDKYPLQKKRHSLEYLREIGHLRPRTNTFGAVLRVRNILSAAVHDFFQSRDFIWVHTPVITASDCEGAGDLFTVTGLNMDKPPRDSDGNIDFSKDFFGKHSYLTVSGQLEAEFLAMSMGNVYTFGPTFRAENSNTSRHLSEFWMIEPEMAFADLDDDITLAQDFIQFLCTRVLEKAGDDIAFFEKFYKVMTIDQLKRISESPFTRISYTEAIKLLQDSGSKFEFPVNWGLDLQSEHERYLTEQVFKGPVIVTDYPKDIKAFYMKLNQDQTTVAAMDVLLPGIGEIIGGSQREDNLDVLTSRMAAAKIPQEEMQWYLDLRRFGSAPHAGFGLGFERLVQYITGMSNIRDVIPCPRTPGTIRF